MKYKNDPIFYFVVFFMTISSPFVMADNKSETLPAVQYEKCNCVNNKYTKHITKPYKKEIEEWQRITAPKKDQQTEAQAVCIECNTDSPENEDLSTFEPIWEWMTETWDSLLGSENEDTPTPTPTPTPTLPPPPRPKHLLPSEEKTPLIPSVCFQMSGLRAQFDPNSQTDFFACTHYHYDGSDKDNFCKEANTKSNKKSSYKKCIATPISCEDTEDPSLECEEKFVNRDKKIRENGCNKGAVYPRRPCMNEEYTAMTAKIFHDVAECMDIDPKEAFITFNHESQFIINNASKENALCYGQVTGPAIADVNSFIDNKPNYQNMEELLPDNISKRCPEEWKKINRVSTQKIKKRHYIKSDHDKCELTLNPYTCFFYSFAYMKILQKKVIAQFQSFNTIKTAEYKGHTFIFWNEEELKGTERNINQKLDTQERVIFPEHKKLENILTTISYNGGTSIPDSIIEDFMPHFKQILSNRNSIILRTQLMSTGISFEVFIKYFQEYLNKNYSDPDKQRRAEVSQYWDSIINDIDALQNNLQSKYPNLPSDTCPSSKNYKQKVNTVVPF